MWFLQRVLSTSSESSVEADTNKAPPIKNGHIDKKVKSGDKPTSKTTKKDEATVTTDSSKDPTTNKKVMKTTTVKDMLRAKRDSLRNMADGGTVASSADDESVSESSSDESDSNENHGKDDEVGEEDNDEKVGSVDGSKKDGLTGSADVKNDVKLPNNVPDELISYIDLLVASAKSRTNSGGKSKFFDSANMELLYQ